MSLDNIQLPPFLIGELYRNHLVETDNQQPIGDNLKAADVVFLGKNQKNIVVIVEDENAVYLADEDLNFLIDVLTACKLSLADIALVNAAKNDMLNYKILQQFKPDIIIFFGVEPGKLEFPLQFPHYQLQKYNNQTYLGAPAVHELVADVQKKKELWACLRNLFSI